VRVFWPLEAKIQNGEWIPFCQKFCVVFSSILQNDGPKPKIFWVKWGTKHTLSNHKSIIDDYHLLKYYFFIFYFFRWIEGTRMANTLPNNYRNLQGYALSPQG
jgi:hypothetical protein